MLVNVDPSVSASVCRPSCGHISETKQVRPIVTMEHSIEVGTADSVAAFRFCRRRPSVEISWFQIKMFKYYYGLMFDFGVRPQLL